MNLSLPEVDDSYLVITFKLLVLVATVAILVVTSVSRTVEVLKQKNRRMGFTDGIR